MRAFGILLTLFIPSLALAHDSWIQTNTNIVRVGDVAHVDLMLGNHGNSHRDFKLASKMDLEGATLDVIDPSGKSYDLKGQLVDTGYAPKEGFWTTRFEPAAKGIHTLTHRSDRVMTYAPERSIKCGKAYFLASESLDNPPKGVPGFDKPVGHELELVPLLNPVAPMGPGSELKLRLLYKGKPLGGERVSFIPRGANLKEGMDDRYERITDANGEVGFVPKEANLFLIVAHKVEPMESGTLEGKPYRFTKYGATLTVFVPNTCPCCAE